MLNGSNAKYHNFLYANPHSPHVVMWRGKEDSKIPYINVTASTLLL